MLRRLAAVAAALVALAGCGGGGDGDDGGERGTPTTDAVKEQLAYLPPQSSVVTVVDLRWEGPNWKHIRDHAERGLDAYRENARPGEEVPESVDEGLRMLGGEAEISFEEDIRPLLDGHLVAGAIEPPRTDAGEVADNTQVFVYRTSGGDLRKIAEFLFSLPGETRLRPHPSRDDVTLFQDRGAIVGDHTMVVVEGPDERKLREEALERGLDGGAGFAPGRLAAAERTAGLDDPFALTTADRAGLFNRLATEDALQRAAGKVPWLDAVRSLSAAARVDEGGAELAAVVTTAPEGLDERDLPLAPPGDLELPRTEGITGASRDQSYTTTFLSRTVRALFADSEFARAVKAAEDDLGVTFEDEVLRQFSCPSMSEFTPASQEFAARSCVRDPERMREMLPRLARHLPRIVRSLQRLEDEGLIALLLIAPDAPLTPGFSTAQIQVEPLPRPNPADELLYEISGLTENRDSRIATAGPDRLVFGMVGDTFVVASDHEAARRAAKLEGEELDEDAASAARIPVERLLLASEGEDERTDDATAAVYALLG
ncbi:MAG: hypothetical protein M3320_10395, partial [Actinomycetota bacterium]|nr:hypothetical protein [Actinomycetota bacterium]